MMLLIKDIISSFIITIVPPLHLLWQVKYNRHNKSSLNVSFVLVYKILSFYTGTLKYIYIYIIFRIFYVTTPQFFTIDWVSSPIVFLKFFQKIKFKFMTYRKITRGNWIKITRAENLVWLGVSARCWYWV